MHGDGEAFQDIHGQRIAFLVERIKSRSEAGQGALVGAQVVAEAAVLVAFLVVDATGCTSLIPVPRVTLVDGRVTEAPLALCFDGKIEELLALK